MSEAALRGAEMLGWTLHPHQLELAKLLDERHETTAVCWPRRAGKTTILWAWILGMCDLNEDFEVVVTAQSGQKSRERYLSAARRLDRYYPEDKGGPRILRGAGDLSMYFPNGSRLHSISPDPDNFRGDAASVILIDEFQAIDPEKSEDIRQGAAPLLDTVEDGMFLLCGTPGRQRAGWYWNALEAGRQGLAGHAISEYAAAEHEDIENESVWLATHPGIGTLTTIDKMRARRASLTTPQWSMEYMGQWPPDMVTRALPAPLWEATAVDPQPIPDGNWTLGFDCAIDGISASLTASWIDEEGHAFMQVMEHRAGTNWVAKEIQKAVTANPRLDVVYDPIGFNVQVAQSYGRLPRANTSRLKALTLKEVGAGAAFISQALADGTLRHANSASLDQSAEAVVWRWNNETRLFGRKASNSDISALCAGSAALFVASGKRLKEPRRKREAVLL
ncbi:terminase large subunit domain-containing protein [Arthrobacter sp. B2a2-09]|uniref:terminase large subunit domain-containing protein n=1 Tax=Arthrobacter sp. B2a2-09 TaxID=2952822 RepID=UPI0022CDA5E0|nr:phage terminase large subunit family protein [Arthrobacter sp. B2a2-09]MCZ9883713.1 phage terminase large subunit family protein [Arthrobacter sp. B2a2-09]